MSYLTQRTFWVGVIERAVRTVAGVLLTTWGMTTLDVRTVDWATSLSIAAGAALVSLVLSVAGGNLSGPAGSASLVYDRPKPARRTPDGP